MSKKKPNIYTPTGKAKKPAAPKIVAKKPTALELEERAKRFELHANYWEKLYDSWVQDMAARTIKLWFGYSLVRPPKK